MGWEGGRARALSPNLHPTSHTPVELDKSLDFPQSRLCLLKIGLTKLDPLVSVVTNRDGGSTELHEAKG